MGVSWKEGKSATWYEVYYQEKDEGAWRQAGTRLTQTSTTISGLENDVTYYIYVVAGNDIGKGPRSDIAEGTPKAIKYERPEGIPAQGILSNDKIASIRGREMEVFSAIGTVGLSTGITRDLNTFSLCVLILVMYCGRIGSMTFAITLAFKRKKEEVLYPEEHINVG